VNVLASGGSPRCRLVFPRERQRGEQVAELGLVLLPAGHGTLVDRLPDLGDARGADGALVAMEFQAGGLPGQPAGGDQAACDRLEVFHGLLVVDVVDRRGEHGFPVVHHPAILLESRGDVLEVVGPADAAEVGHPAGDGDIAQVAAAVDEQRAREQDREQAEVYGGVTRIRNMIGWT